MGAAFCDEGVKREVIDACDILLLWVVEKTAGRASSEQLLSR